MPAEAKHKETISCRVEPEVASVIRKMADDQGRALSQMAGVLLRNLCIEKGWLKTAHRVVEVLKENS